VSFDIFHQSWTFKLVSSRIGSHVEVFPIQVTGFLPLLAFYIEHLRAIDIDESILNVRVKLFTNSGFHAILQVKQEFIRTLLVKFLNLTSV